MNLDRVIPWIDVSEFPAVGCQVSRGTHENSTQVHELAEREVGQENADKKKMDINPFLSLVGLGLGVYVAILIETLVAPYLFTVHYYMQMLVVVFTLAFMYNIIKLTK